MAQAADRSAPQRWQVALLERCRYCSRPQNLRATTRIAVVVGVLVTASNEGDTLASGHAGIALPSKIPLNVIVPFLVSNLGLLAARREPQR